MNYTLTYSKVGSVEMDQTAEEDFADVPLAKKVPFDDSSSGFSCYAIT